MNVNAGTDKTGGIKKLKSAFEAPPPEMPMD
jgi:hypothetical protein